MLVYFLAYSTNLKMGGGGHFPLKRRLTFNGLHGVIYQKMVLFITTAVRTSNATEAIMLQREIHVNIGFKTEKNEFKMQNYVNIKRYNPHAKLYQTN
jgi:hypothetical protein